MSLIILNFRLKACEPPGLLQGSLGPFGPEVSPAVSLRVSPKTGVSKGVSHGVSPGPFGLRARECLKSVPRVSPECLGHLFDTPGTLSGHFSDIPDAGARKAPETLRGTLSWTPRFSGTLSGTLPETLRARRARETPVAGRRVRNLKLQLDVHTSLIATLKHVHMIPRSWYRAPKLLKPEKNPKKLRKTPPRVGPRKYKQKYRKNTKMAQK